MPATPSWPWKNRTRRCWPTSGWPSRALPVALALALLLPAAARAQAPTTAEEEIETCLGCHEDASATVDLPSGETVSLGVDKAAFARSVHGKVLKCTDCHPAMAEIPHPEGRWKTKAEFRATLRESCRTCHFDTYRQTLDGVHHALAARGDARAPSCADCHGSHEITHPNAPRSRISQTCSACHSEISATYAKSVHGRALVEEQNADVPVCTDCHRSHDIADPRTEAWRLTTPQLCGKCHTDKARMAKYGLSTNVVQTYLTDFHGMAASLRKGDGREGGQVTALCIDCHGVHDITRARDPGSPVLKANLARTCRKCHPGASESFPAAWLSHYEPSFSKAPLVYGVKVFYSVLIPFMIGGLVLQVVLHLWRFVVNR